MTYVYKMKGISDQKLYKILIWYDTIFSADRVDILLGGKNITNKLYAASIYINE